MNDQHTFLTWDDYFIPGTNVLRNKFVTPTKPYGETDQRTLRVKEEYAAILRLEQLASQPIEGRFDYDHMKAIHHHIFQDVYEWAGQERAGDIGDVMIKYGPDVVHHEIGDPAAPLVPYEYYPVGPGLTVAAEHQYSQLAAKNLLRGLDHDQFTVELADVWAEINVIHSFREGNTRSQFVFFSQLAMQAGWKIDPSRFGPNTPAREAFVAARFYRQATGKTDRLADVLSPHIRELDAADMRPPRPQLPKLPRLRRDFPSPPKPRDHIETQRRLNQPPPDRGMSR